MIWSNTFKEDSDLLTEIWIFSKISWSLVSPGITVRAGSVFLSNPKLTFFAWACMVCSHVPTNVYSVSWMHLHMLEKHTFNMCCLHREFKPSQEFFRYVLRARNRDLWSQTFPENANAFNEACWEGLSGLERQQMERFISEMCAEWLGLSAVM